MRFLLSLFLFGSAVSFAISDETNYQVLGIGTTCTDFIIHVDDAFLERHAGGEKGGAYLIPLDIFDAILSANPGKMQILPGGSAANTIRGLGILASRAYSSLMLEMTSTPSTSSKVFVTAVLQVTSPLRQTTQVHEFYV